MKLNKETLTAATTTVVTLAKNKNVQIGAAGTAGVLVGGGLGYILGRRGVGSKVGDLVIMPADEDLELLLAEEEGEDFSELLKAREELAGAWIGDNPWAADEDPVYDDWELDDDAELNILEEEDEDGEPLVENVFDGPEDTWDYEAELSSRSSSAPYVIHVDEYVTNESGLTQSTVVYYAGDDIMADENDTPIYGYAGLMGDLKFGHGSQDPSAVYIRNEAMALEWEVLLHDGSYEIEVLGFSVEQDYEDQDNHLEHSLHKFRD